MPSLLVSVKNLCEAEAAIAGCTDILDFKNPAAGPLAPVDPCVWKQASELFGVSAGVANGQATGQEFRLSAALDFRLSAALGEGSQARRVAASVPEAFTFSKAGPSGCRSDQTVKQLWCDVRQELPDSVSLVAVAYADHVAAGCLAPELILAAAAESGLKYFLVDTFIKQGRCSIQHLGWHGIRRLVDQAHRHDIFMVLAGTVRRADMRRCSREGIPVDGFGIRGDVCVGGRSGRLDAGRVKHWKAGLSG